MSRSPPRRLPVKSLLQPLLSILKRHCILSTYSVGNQQKINLAHVTVDCASPSRKPEKGSQMLIGSKCTKPSSFFKARLASWNAKDNSAEVQPRRQAAHQEAYMVDTGGNECFNSKMTKELSTISEAGLDSERRKVPSSNQISGAVSTLFPCNDCIR